MKTVLLGDIARINMGQSPKSEFYNTDSKGLPFMQGVRTFGKMYPIIDTWCTKPTKTADEGDILFSVRAPVGDLNYAPCHMCIGRGLASLKSRNNKYLFYLLEANKGRLISSQTGSVFGSVNAAILKNFKISVLDSFKQQDEIADILSSLDKKIELNRKMNETLEQIGQALFRHYFIDNPEANKWSTRTLGDFFDVKTGKKDANFGTSDGKYPFFTCSQNVSKAPDYSFDGTALLLAGNGEFNLKYYRGKFEAYQRTYVLMPNNENHLGYLFFLMSLFLDEITNGSRGSVIKFITKGMIENFKINVPDDLTISKLSETLNQITINIEKNKEQIQTLTNLRDALLPRLISGKIKI